MRALNLRLHCIVALSLLIFTTSCKKDKATKTPTSPAKGIEKNVTAKTVAFPEGFETGTKSAYASGNVTLGTGSWHFDDALIGNLSNDIKVGAASARIRNTGSITMNFNTTGVNTVNISHAAYGTDGGSTWQLWISTDNGSSYKQTGATLTSTSGSMKTASFTVNAAGNIRLSIRKISGASNRLNIDNISIYNSDNGATEESKHLLLGNPSGAVANVTSPTNYLIDQTYYAVSYSRTRGIPNWISWHVGSNDIGNARRQDDFRPNTALPAGWYQVTSASYQGSGFDRGHNCPSGDRSASVAANSSTFLMTNMIPQAPNNNQKTWNNLEMYTRSLINAGNEVYIIMGSYGTGGTGSNGSTTRSIDNGRVTVPSNIWKVIVVLPEDDNDLSRITKSTRVIAVNTPNINSINSDWKKYLTTVDAIEEATGYDLLSALPLDVQKVIEAKIDNE
ncbi:DNA/RNA non-specific endonuclease [Chitinophaga rhizophila]|uniref:DNA/RNA non-specific endonuclease n=1 Tax=Chitinophaga rhizophila TaxID=2866212 RepID=A0ABS7G9K1_9BACT|nr:DNA/RNA non-specific endonuclease [Chitinophaga rhizophila]MBW8683387.1 DNA/RNA non-specific endonuclease [Chitinophaga rhizophila]